VHESAPEVGAVAHSHDKQPLVSILKPKSHARSHVVFRQLSSQVFVARLQTASTVSAHELGGHSTSSHTAAFGSPTLVANVGHSQHVAAAGLHSLESPHAAPGAGSCPGESSSASRPSVSVLPQQAAVTNSMATRNRIGVTRASTSHARV
jgi:hypothetical protein